MNAKLRVHFITPRYLPQGIGPHYWIETKRYFLTSINWRVALDQERSRFAASVGGALGCRRAYSWRRLSNGIDGLVSKKAPLVGRRVAVPETRQMDVLAGLLERRGAHVVRCPLVGIHDVEDSALVDAWIAQAIAQPFDDLILLTGEGLRRLLGFAQRSGSHDAFVAALPRMRSIVRGPKPAKVLRELGVHADLKAEEATTAGLIASLSAQRLTGRRIGVQLYGQEPNRPLQEFLRAAGAEVFPVAPYRYADAVEDGKVKSLIQSIIAGEFDAVCFTSSPQLRRLRAVARAENLMENFEQAMRTGVVIAAVGPVVAQTLKAADMPVHLMPENSWFMKPLVQALVDYWAAA